MAFFGTPYPIVKHPLGLLHSQSDLDLMKADLLILLLTNPGERVMLLDYGTPLRTLFFEPTDQTIINATKQMIAQAVEAWEPRIQVRNIEVTIGMDSNDLNSTDTREENDHILGIRIQFFDPANISDVEELVLELPLGSTGG